MSNDVAAARPCRPYLEATGVSYDLPPYAFITVAAGTPLVIAGRVPGDLNEDLGESPDVLMVAPASAPGFHATPPELGIRAYFALDTNLGDGVVARRGVPTMVTGALDRDRVAIETISEVSLAEAYDAPYTFGSAFSGVARVAPCTALATTRQGPPSRWVPAHPATLTDTTDLVSEGGAWLDTAHIGTVVDVIEVRGSRAWVVADHEGYLFSGWVDAALLEEGGGEEEEEEGGTGFSSSWTRGPRWRDCRGSARISADARLLSGPNHWPDVVTLPSLGREVEVALMGTDGSDRLVEIEAPLSGVDTLVAWANIADLSADCMP